VQVLIDSPDSLLASLPSGNEPGRLILVTGPSGSGKTSWCQRLAEEALGRGLDLAGLVSPAVWRGGRKTAIDLLDLASGERRRLAQFKPHQGADSSTWDWEFDQQVLDWGNAVLSRITQCPRIILDELGPLEFEHASGLTAGLDLVAGHGYELACVVVRPSLLARALERWPWGQTLQIPLHKPTGVEFP